MADNVQLVITVDGNTDTNWTTSADAMTDILGSYTTAGVTSILETECSEGRMVRTETLLDSNSIEMTYSWNDSNNVASFFESADFSATKTVVSTNVWTSSGKIIYLNDTEQTFTI